jgi:urease accessory protein
MLVGKIGVEARAALFSRVAGGAIALTGMAMVVA